MNALTVTGKRLFLRGDEAVARAALEVGVEVATGYPGNPGTKAITALISLARQYGWLWIRTFSAGWGYAESLKAQNIA